jgi:TonB family protein
VLAALSRGVALATNTRERVVYLLPPIPTERHLDSAGLSYAPASTTGRLGGTHRSGRGRGGTGHGTDARVSGHVEAPAAGPGYDNEVFVESEVDQAVVRDPGSAAPEYPAGLIELRIEGTLTVEYIVDTTGLADSASLRVVQSSHPAFVESLRAALPHMHFTPAMIGTHKVRQWVRQEFVFRIPAEHPANTSV